MSPRLQISTTPPKSLRSVPLHARERSEADAVLPLSRRWRQTAPTLSRPSPQRAARACSRRPLWGALETWCAAQPSRHDIFVQPKSTRSRIMPARTAPQPSGRPILGQSLQSSCPQQQFSQGSSAALPLRCEASWAKDGCSPFVSLEQQRPTCRQLAALPIVRLLQREKSHQRGANPDTCA